MGLFSSLKDTLGTPRSGGLLNYALSGSSGVERSHLAQQREKLQGLLGALPLPNDYAPPSHAAPNGEADPLADVPYQSRVQGWLRDYAAAGGNVPLDTLLPQQARPQAIEGTDGIYERDPAGQWSRKVEYPAKVDPNADLRRQMLEQQVATQKALEEQRKAQAGYLGVKTRQPYAPQRPRASGGGGSGGGAPRRIGSQAEFAALPSGSTFVAPDGTIRRKP